MPTWPSRQPGHGRLPGAGPRLTPDAVKALAIPVLSHRIILNTDARLKEHTRDPQRAALPGRFTACH
jgi:hypothetical protein